MYNSLLFITFQATRSESFDCAQGKLREESFNNTILKKDFSLLCSRNDMKGIMQALNKYSSALSITVNSIEEESLFHIY